MFLVIHLFVRASSFLFLARPVSHQIGSSGEQFSLLAISELEKESRWKKPGCLGSDGGSQGQATLETDGRWVQKMFRLKTMRETLNTLGIKAGLFILGSHFYLFVADASSMLSLYGCNSHYYLLDCYFWSTAHPPSVRHAAGEQMHSSTFDKGSLLKMRQVPLASNRLPRNKLVFRISQRGQDAGIHADTSC